MDLIPQNAIEHLKSIIESREEKQKRFSAKAIEIPIEHAIQAYIDSQNNPHSKRARKSDLKLFLKFLWENRIEKIGQLGEMINQETIALIEAFLEAEIRRGISIQSIQRRKISIIMLIRFLHEQFPELISPPPKLKNPRHKAHYTIGITPALNIEQWIKIRNQLGKNPSTRRVLVMCQIGLLLGGRRLSEIQNLRWKDIDFIRKTIEIKPAKSRSDATIHTLPLHDQLAEILAEFRKICPQKNQDDQPFNISQQSIDASLRRHGRKVGIQKLSFHCMRATFITWAIERGDTMSEILNATLHKSPGMIRYYDRTSKLRTTSINKMNEI